ncbi:DUF6603 domain-containing protein [Embleya sp. NBC_00896]|uniref:DUF6603 domain-containing protein n=1 Tax=Embleya sp. NBC_00896 TaxID=2975961 RepID=UPI002F9156E5|nr:hypothetical protein OG928_38460 [Embleya sp. NBC_00896]
MAIQVEELRALLTGDGDSARRIEVAGKTLGLSPDPFGVWFPDGVLRLDRTDGSDDGAAELWCTGRAATVLGEEPVSVRVDFTLDADLLTGVAITAEYPAPGVPAHVLAERLGGTCPTLPDAAAATSVTTIHNGAGPILSAHGPGNRLAVLGGALPLLIVEAQGWQVLSTARDLTADQLAQAAGLLTAAAHSPTPAVATDLPAGAWLVLPGPRLVPIRPDRASAPRDPDRRDGLGRALPVRTAKSGTTRARSSLRPPPKAIAGPDGFTVLAPGATRNTRGWSDIGMPTGDQAVSIDYENSPLRIAGALTAIKAVDPYKAILGGVLLVDTGGLYGTAMGAYVFPANSSVDPSFFGFGSLGSEKGIGPPPFQIRGIALGIGWNSRIRIPRVEDVDSFPFVLALSNPGAIGAESEDPVAILGNLVGGGNPWVRPAQGEVWVAAGLAFSAFELIQGNAMVIVQTGADFTVALLGIGGTSFPRDADFKYAKAELAIQAVIKPNKGELSLGAAIAPSSYVLDPNCRLRGAVSLTIWYGNSPNAGDFVFSMGGYHPSYQRPTHYNAPARLGFDWDLSGNVTISGSAYFAITPAAVMAGGGLDVRFQSGALRAWLTAKVDALVQWKPFYFDIGISVRVGVQARIKIWFIKITITIEVGVSLRVWGPPTGGEATIHLWFISFTIGFGADRQGTGNELDWDRFKDMLPPADNTVRAIPGAGLISDRVVATRGARRVDAWQTSTAGFEFSTDSAVPVTALYLGTGTTAVETGSPLNIRPMGQSGRTSVQRVSLAYDTRPADLHAWGRTRITTAVPQALWGAGKPNHLPLPGQQLIGNQLIGAKFGSPPAEYGVSTGYISEKAIAFDPVNPDGPVPLDPATGPTGPIPTRPTTSVIGRIRDTVDASAQRTARTALAAALTGIGHDLGALDTNLPAFAAAAATAFTAEPMLVPVG